MATFYLNSSPLFSFGRNFVPSSPNINGNFLPTKYNKRKYRTTNYISCGKAQSSVEEEMSTPQKIAINDSIAIRSFLKGKRIFVTGATGFIAKGIVEKILRTTPQVDKLYIMIRAKDNEDARCRIEKEIIDDEVFRLLKEEYGQHYKSFMLSKLVAVAGNLREDDLGMNTELTSEMENVVEAIIHSAGSTTFDERFDQSLDVNTRGACRVMTFAKGCKRLKVFLYLSTAYACGKQEGKIMEEPYRMTNKMGTVDIKKEMMLAFHHTNMYGDKKDLPNKMKEMGLKRALSNGWQDTYSFTKAMAEMMLYQIKENVPLVVLRPSSVLSALNSPFQGWIQGNKTYDPIIIQIGKGKLEGFPMNPDSIVDIIPVDLVVNAIIAALVKHGDKKREGSLDVYNITSSGSNPLKMRELFEYAYQHFISNPLLDRHEDPIEVKKIKIFSSKEEYMKSIYKSNDSIPNFKLRNKVTKYAQDLGDLYQHYLYIKVWFDDKNTRNLLDALSKEDRDIFDFDVKKIDWKEYITKIHISGIKKHVLRGRYSISKIEN